MKHPRFKSTVRTTQWGQKAEKNRRLRGFAGKDYSIRWKSQYFIKGTFKSMSEMFYKETGRRLQRNIPTDNLELGAWAFSKGYQEHWECY